MKDDISIGSSPCDSECAQLGDDGYHSRAMVECSALIAQIKRELGSEPEGAFLKIKNCPHDFGSYYDVICVFDTENAKARNYAFKCESDTPMRWDEVARRFLKDAGYPALED